MGKFGNLENGICKHFERYFQGPCMSMKKASQKCMKKLFRKVWFLKSYMYQQPVRCHNEQTYTRVVPVNRGLML